MTTTEFLQPLNSLCMKWGCGPCVGSGASDTTGNGFTELTSMSGTNGQGGGCNCGDCGVYDTGIYADGFGGGTPSIDGELCAIGDGSGNEFYSFNPII